MTEPRLSAGAVRDVLAIICAENGKELDDLAPGVFTVAIESLSAVARAVAQDEGEGR